MPNKRCVSCGKEIAGHAYRCAYCKADQPEDSTEEKWAAIQVPANLEGGIAKGDTSATSLIWLGALLAVGVGVLSGVVGLDTVAGVLLLVVGGVIAQIMILIGVIAKGVEIGIRAAR